MLNPKSAQDVAKKLDNQRHESHRFYLKEFAHSIDWVAFALNDAKIMDLLSNTEIIRGVCVLLSHFLLSSTGDVHSSFPPQVSNLTPRS